TIAGQPFTSRIREARIPFEVDAAELPERLFAVLEAVYAAYGSGWEDLTGDAVASRGLTEEAVWVARLIVALLPEEPEAKGRGAPEAKGLLAPLTYSKARERARRTPDGRYSPLSMQDTARWDRECLVEAEATLAGAARLGRLGPFQLEAAIQSAHMHARLTGK